MHFNMRTIFIIICVLIGLLLAACSGSSRSASTTDVNRQGLSLEIYNEAGELDSTLANQYAFTVTKTTTGGRKVDILIDTPGIKVAYIKLNYDPSKESPVDAKLGDFYPAGNTPLFSGFLYKYGYVPLAAVTPNWNTKPAIAGKGTLATVTFNNHPFDKSRDVSAWDQVDGINPLVVVGQGDLSDDTTKPAWDKATSKISFYEVFIADCNVNGKVDFADFGTIGANYSKLVASSPGAEPADANGKGKVDFADFGAVGAKYGQGVAGYKIYRDSNKTPSTVDKTYINGTDYKRTAVGKRGWAKIEITCGGAGDNVFVVPVDTSSTEKSAYGLILTPGGSSGAGSLTITIADAEKTNFGAGEDGSAANPFNITTKVGTGAADVTITLKATFKKDPDPDVDLSTTCTYSISPGFLATFTNNVMTISKDVFNLFGMPKVTAVPNDTVTYGSITSNELYPIYPFLPE